MGRQSTVGTGTADFSGDSAVSRSMLGRVSVGRGGGNGHVKCGVRISEWGIIGRLVGSRAGNGVMLGDSACD